MTKKQIIIFSSFFLLAFFASAKNARALDITTTNLNLATVQAAVNQVAAAGGGTVYLPAGTSPAWSGDLYVPGGVNIIGADSGTTMRTRGADQKWGPQPTTIINGSIGYNLTGHDQNFTKGARVAFIKFTKKTGNVINVAGVPGMRVDHNNFDSANGMYVVNMDSNWSDPGVPTTGVVDHNNFIKGDYGVHVGPRLISTLAGLGSGSAVFVEDNYLNINGHPIAGLNGAHWVLRYNYITSLLANGDTGYGIDAHGPVFEDLGGSGSSQQRGTQYTETYNNTLYADPLMDGSSGNNWGAMRLRSGVGTIFNNTFIHHRHAVIFTEDFETCSRAGVDAPRQFWIWNNTYTDITEEVIFNDGLGCSPSYIHLITSCNPLNANAICTDNTTAKPAYTPYTYPHPLTLTGSPESDITSPSVSITAPVSGLTVSGSSVNVSANASDNVGVVGVQFKLDGVNLGQEDTANPYSIVWNTTQVSNSSHTLTAAARDIAGNQRTSTGITVTVSNTIDTDPTVSTNLLASYSFNEGSGTLVADSSGNNKNGTLVNGPVWISGKFGNAIQFDGINDYISVGDLDASPVTISLWMKQDQFLNGWGSLVVKRYTYGFEINGQTVYFSVGNGSGWNANRSTGITLGQWEHLAAVYNGSTIALYKNGTQVGSSVSASFENSNNPLFIGSWDTSSEFFKGIIDEVRIYSRALTQSEIQADMNTPIGQADTTPPASPIGVIVI